MARRRGQRRGQRSQLVTAVTIVVTVLLLWALSGVSAGGPLLFLATCVGLAVYAAGTFSSIATDRCGWQRIGIATLITTFVGVAMVFDTTAADAFGVLKFTVLMLGTCFLAFVLVGDRIQHEHRFLWRNGLHWVVAAFLGWTLVTTLLSPTVRMSLLGFYKSYDGFITTAAFALIFFAFVHLISINDVRLTLFLLFIVAGGLATVYGLIQLHDRIFDTQNWDWGNWGESGFDQFIWSGLGNPNHLSAFLAIMLPIGLALLLSPYMKRYRLAVGAVIALSILEIIQTASRGAWLAVFASLAFFAIFLLKDTRWVRSVSLPAVGALIAGIIVAGVLLGRSQDITQPLRSMFDTAPGSTGAQRLELWDAALAMAADEPLFGVGPDLYRVSFPRYQSAQFVEQFGPSEPANGPHNVFYNYLATEGFVGLAAFLLLIVYGGLRAAAAGRRVRAREKEASEAQKVVLRDVRLMLVGSASGLVAYLVQGSFNIQQLPLSLAFWTLLGAICSIALDVGVPASLNPRALFHAQEEEEEAPIDAKKKRKARPSEAARPHLETSALRPRTSKPQRRSSKGGVALAVAFLAFAALAVTATRPFRADRVYVDARNNLNAGEDSDDDLQDRSADYQEAIDEYETVTSTNPWTRLYAANAGDAAFKYAKFLAENPSLAGGRETEETMLELAQAYTRKALEVGGEDIFAQRLLGEVLLEMAKLEGSDEATRERALAALTTALRWNPWDPETVRVLMQALIDQGYEERAREVFEAAPENVQQDAEVAALADQLDDSD